MSISKSRVRSGVNRMVAEAGENGTRVDLRKLARTGQAIGGKIDVSASERLADRLADKPVDVADKPVDVADEDIAGAGEHITLAYRITGGQDTHGWPTVTLVLEGVVPLVCQRCLQPFGYELKSEATLRLAASEAELASWDAEDVEAVLATEPVEVQELVEDELLLSLPYAPVHEPQACPVKAGAGQELPPAPSVFSELARLKKR